jgi:hypothetical protein
MTRLAYESNSANAARSSFPIMPCEKRAVNHNVEHRDPTMYHFAFNSLQSGKQRQERGEAGHFSPKKIQAFVLPRFTAQRCCQKISSHHPSLEAQVDDRFIMIC